MMSNENEKRQSLSCVGEIGSNVLFLFCVAVCMSVFFDEYVWQKKLTLVQIVILGICSVIVSSGWRLLSRKARHPYLIGDAVICLLSLLGGVLWWNGALQMINGVFEWYSKRTGNLLEAYVVNESIAAAGGIFFALSILLLYLWMMQGFLQQHKGLCIAIGIIPFCLAEFFLGIHFVAMCAIGLWIVFLYYLYYAFCYGYTVSFQTEKCTIGIFLLCILLIGTATGAGIVYEGQFKQWKKAEKSKIETQVYGKSDLYDGDFTGKKQASDSKELRLTIDTDSNSVLYLKGFVGSRYEDHRWKALDDTEYAKKHRERFRWLASRQWSLWTQTFKALSYTSYQEQGTKNVRVKNVQASQRYQYQPYFAATNGGSILDKSHDTTLQNAWYAIKKNRSYRIIEMKDIDYLTIQPLAQLESKKSQKKVADYLESEWAYREFAKEEYLAVPKEYQAFFQKQIKTKIQDLSVQEKAVLIRQYLLDITDSKEASTEDFAAQSKTDPVLGFLQKHREGGCASYAAAGTLLFRYCGIPARYVEGYVSLPEDDSTNSDIAKGDTGDGTISSQYNEDKSQMTVRNVYANEAHAWVEIYQDGLGWIPVEVSPKYYGKGENAHRKQRVDQVKTEELQSEVKMPDKKTAPKSELPIRIYVVIVLCIIAIWILFLLVHRGICRYLRKKGRQQGTLSDQIGYLAKELSYWLKTDGIQEAIQRKDSFIGQMQKYDRLLQDGEECTKKMTGAAFAAMQRENTHNGNADKGYPDNVIQQQNIRQKESDIQEILTILERRAFSEEEVKKEEKAIVENYIEKIKRQIYHNATHFKRILLIVWYGI